MTGTDHPPSTNSPARTNARRALWSSVAAVAVVVVPITVASATNGPDADAAEVDGRSITTLQAESHLMRAQSVGFPALADLETVATAVAPPTTAPPTTTTAPPTTTTTVPPPPPPPPPPPAPVAPTASGTGYSDPNNPAAWDRLAECESGGNWASNTGNGYYGGIQFSLSSWQGVGGSGYPHEASRETQIAMGQRLWNQGGWSHWPSCSRQLGYR